MGGILKGNYFLSFVIDYKLTEKELSLKIYILVS